MNFNLELFSWIVPIGVICIIGGTSIYIFIDSKKHPEKYSSTSGEEGKRE